MREHSRYYARPRRKDAHMSPARRTTHVPKIDDTSITPGSGNVFEDLGLPDADIHLAKLDLSRVIEDIMKAREWTQKKAASVLGIATSDMSDLIRGKLARFSLERLERFLVALDMDVRIQVAPRKKRSKAPRVSVQRLERL